MSKRFIDTEMFSDEWFSERSKDGKLAYIYLLTRCNHAGIWKVNRRLFKFETGIDFDRVIKQLGNRLVTVSEEFIFLPKFIHFQYPNWPNSNVKQQSSAIAILESFGITDINKVTVSKGLDNHYDTDTVIVNDIKDIKPQKKVGLTRPTLSEVKQYFKENGYKQSTAEIAFKYYEAGNWVKANGDKVKNWKQTMIAVWFKDENRGVVKLEDIPIVDRMEYLEEKGYKRTSKEEQEYCKLKAV